MYQLDRFYKGVKEMRVLISLIWRTGFIVFGTQSGSFRKGPWFGK